MKERCTDCYYSMKRMNENPCNNCTHGYKRINHWRKKE